MDPGPIFTWILPVPREARARLRAMKWKRPWTDSSKMTLPSRSRIKISVAWKFFASQSRKMRMRSRKRVREGAGGGGEGEDSGGVPEDGGSVEGGDWVRESG